MKQENRVLRMEVIISIQVSIYNIYTSKEPNMYVDQEKLGVFSSKEYDGRETQKRA